MRPTSQKHQSHVIDQSGAFDPSCIDCIAYQIQPSGGGPHTWDDVSELSDRIESRSVEMCGRCRILRVTRWGDEPESRGTCPKRHPKDTNA